MVSVTISNTQGKAHSVGNVWVPWRKILPWTVGFFSINYENLSVPMALLSGASLSLSLSAQVISCTFCWQNPNSGPFPWTPDSTANLVPPQLLHLEVSQNSFWEPCPSQSPSLGQWSKTLWRCPDSLVFGLRWSEDAVSYRLLPTSSLAPVRRDYWQRLLTDISVSTVDHSCISPTTASNSIKTRQSTVPPPPKILMAPHFTQ